MSRVLGNQGERISVAYLQKKGWTIRTTNFFARFGEVDIIAIDTQGVLVFIEVKSHARTDFIHPLETITTAKQSKWYKSAELYIHKFNLYDKDCRFDAIIVNPITEEVMHFQNVLQH